MSSDILVTDLIQALYLDAANETDPERRAQLESDAHTFDDVWKRSKYALAPTRDAMTAAIGNASLNLSDRIEELLDISRDTHVQMQDMHQQLPELIRQVTDLTASVRAVTVRLGKLEHGQAELATITSDLGEKLNELSARQDNQWLDVINRLTTDEQRIDEKREWLERLDRQIADIRAEMDLRMPDLQRIIAQLTGFLDLADDAMIAIDEQQTITWVNGATEAIFGYHSPDLLGKSIDILIPERFQEAHRHHIIAFATGALLNRRMAERRLVLGITKDGREVEFKAAISRTALYPSTYTVVLRPVDR